MENEITRENNSNDYMGCDLAGFPYNRKFPPNIERYGDEYYGYPTKAAGVLFYDFAVMGYDVEFTYKGRKFFLLNDGEASLSDSKFSERIKTFENPMELIENLKIEGQALIQILDQIEDIEPV